MKLKSFEKRYENTKVGVLMGGTSSEREVSLCSGKEIANALERVGFVVTRIDLVEDALNAAAKNCDVIFPALHGGFGENGGIQSLLDRASLPYVGSDADASALCMNKDETKKALANEGVSCPKSVILRSKNASLNDEMHFPLVIKPISGGSSVLLFIVDDEESYAIAIDEAMASGEEVMIEQFVKGTELSISLLDGESLTPVQIVPPNGVYDYDAKYLYANGKTQYFCPPQGLNVTMMEKLKVVAESSWRILGMRDVGRIDVILTEDGVPYVLEANTLPGFTPTSLVPKASAYAGIGYDELCTHLVLTAMERGSASN